MDDVDVCVIGAGAIGLAIARTISQYSNSVLILDQNPSFGQETSSRNSEVIHAGIYYPPGSLKARLCVEGKQLLYRYCQQKNIPHRRLGKIIVATAPEQRRQLDSLITNAEANGVNDLEKIDKSKLSQLEPAVRGVEAVLSPSTGILDSHAFMQNLLFDAEKNGASFVPYTQVTAIDCQKNYFIIETINTDPNSNDKESYMFSARYLINAAGLHAHRVANSIANMATDIIPQTYFAKGCYYSYQHASPFNHLIYPVVDANSKGLGIHATLDMARQVKFGPDVEYIDTLDYSVTGENKKAFYQAITHYFPAISIQDLHASHAGIRPKLQSSNDVFKDFYIQTSNEHGMENLIQLFGIESPGLTASMAIARHVVQQLLP